MSVLKKLARIAKLALAALLLVLLLCNVYVLVASKGDPGAYPTVFGFSSAVVVSGSMEPAIGVDDLIVVKAQKTYQVGDVITFSTSGKLPVTHRIIGETPDGSFVTQGDANNAPDAQPVPREQVAGKVFLVLAGGGKVISFLRTPLGMLLITLVLFSVLALPNRTKD